MWGGQKSQCITQKSNREEIKLQILFEEKEEYRSLDGEEARLCVS